ncbi:hypothetical protein KHS38_14495 [Mucilaginibacter sp. Bleaf8]|uniref:hypothetical protein n=1 Tax=Mucilaginibacter sp. Bleaf8 TaxID=2834430 RepID=UPI001BCC79DA|nr:hypothetical protein [Mucilaginibacter sp. Bleaf8]MBS7565618.1 hypothetical protein [Mucilaginibacter sp. Bleaf8]
MNTIEERLWSYIDGTCTAQEKEEISKLIQEDKEYRMVYDELLSFNQELSVMELDEPSMPFTYNVMEAIRTQEAQKPLKAAIDVRIIKVIAAFFIVTISVLLIYTIANVNWSAGNTSAVEFKIPSIKNYISKSAMQGFIFFDVVLALYLLDGYLRKRNNLKTM